MESVVPPQACVNAPQRYVLRAGDAFAVVGTLTGYVHPIIADASGNCVRDPKAAPTEIGRIPLTALACDPTADPLTGALPGGGFEANPCQETTTQSEFESNFANLAGGSCTLGSPAQNLVDRTTTAIKFRARGMTLEIVDPTYPGDAVCTGDMSAKLGNIPIVSEDTQISFHVTAGFSPLLLPSTPALPVKVLRGPTQSIWVVDEGDYLSTSIDVASTRGKVFRVEGQNPTIVNLLE
jgi:hypothetical protein